MPAKKTARPAAKRKPPAKKAGKASPRDRGFLQALADLLEARGLEVPKGLLRAPPEAYAKQAADFVQTLGGMATKELTAYAQKIADYGAKQAERARGAWNTSPLITELRRRGLKEPPIPKKVTAFAISVKKRLEEWSDTEILEAAKKWSKRGS